MPILLPDAEWHWRRLPHVNYAGATQFVTFRLADALPPTLRQQLPVNACAEQRHKVIEHLSDRGYGSCLLRYHCFASFVEETMRFGHGSLYNLLAWSIMPNHVHAVVELLNDEKLYPVVKTWKVYSARRINELAGLSGRLWAREYRDRGIRNDIHLEMAIGYTENNPVKAGLVREVADWRFSSAWHRAGQATSAPSVGFAGVCEVGDWMRI